MLARRAIVAYVLAFALSLTSLAASWRTVRVPWITNHRREYIGLWNFYSASGAVVEFPDTQLCRQYAGFCASWRTATFLLTLSLVPNTLVLVSLVFSWVFHHRKKTVLVVKYLLGTALLLQVGGMLLWRSAFPDLNRLVRGFGPWYLIGGWHLVFTSTVASVLLMLLIIPFRRIVRVPIEDGTHADDSDSDEEENTVSSTRDADTVSIEENVPEDQLDFYIFNKQARRRALAASGA